MIDQPLALLLFETCVLPTPLSYAKRTWRML